MGNHISFIIWLIFFTLIIIANVIYTFKIIPTLSKYGRNSSFEGLPSKQWKQVKEYKKLCEENNLQKWHAYFAISFPFVELVLLLIWFLLSK